MQYFCQGIDFNPFTTKNIWLHIPSTFALPMYPISRHYVVYRGKESKYNFHIMIYYDICMNIYNYSLVQMLHQYTITTVHFLTGNQ